jgi:filamentous hemagglutinin
VNGLHIDVKQVNQQTVSQAIDAMVKADPQLAWLKEAEQRGDVDWRQVKEIHDSFKYSHSGLGQGAMLAIIIVVSALTAGAASGPLGAAAGASAGSGTAMAAAGSSAMVTAGTATGVAAAGWGNVMITAALSSMVGTAAASTINNKGNLGKVLGDVTSTDALKSYATGAAIAGFGAAFTNGWGRELTSDGNYKTVSYAERVKAYTAALKGFLSGSDKKSWLIIAGTGAMTEAYEYSAGRGPDARPGVDRDLGPQYAPLEGGYVPQINEGSILREGKNIGLNLVEGCDSFYSVCHGTPVSNILNQVPGFNGFATLHDGWMINLEAYKGTEMSLFENLGSMPPALLVNYGSLYDKYRTEIESEKKREN